MLIQNLFVANLINYFITSN